MKLRKGSSVGPTLRGQGRDREGARVPAGLAGRGRLAPRRCSGESRLRLPRIFLSAEGTGLGPDRGSWGALTAAEARPGGGDPFPKPGWGPVTPDSSGGFSRTFGKTSWSVFPDLPQLSRLRELQDPGPQRPRDEYTWTGVWPSVFFNLSRRETRVRPWGVGGRLGGHRRPFHLPLERGNRRS